MRFSPSIRSSSPTALLAFGHSVSSGCIRMLNQDVMDLYGRAPVGVKVVVLGSRLS